MKFLHTSISDLVVIEPEIYSTHVVTFLNLITKLNLTSTLETQFLFRIMNLDL